jgi:hypothetical protein
VILDNDDDLDKAGSRGQSEGASDEVDTGHIELDASLRNTSSTSELASAITESTDASGLWYDIEEDRYIEEPAQGLGSHEQHSVPSTPGQAQLQILPQAPKPLPDQTSQQGVDDITRSTPVESTLYSIPQSSDSGNNRWTDESMAELEKELELALEEQQVEPSSVGTPTSPSLRSVEEPQNKTQSREHTEATGIRPEGVQDASRHAITAHGLEELGPRESEVAVQGRDVAMQQQELAAQKQELGQLAVDDQLDLVEVVDAGDPGEREATEALISTQSEILEVDEHRFRLRGIRARRLAGRQTKTTQYRVVWGEHPNRSDSWFNEDDVRLSIPRPHELYPQNLALQTEMDISRVCNMRSSLYKRRKVFEYLVDVLHLGSRTWITEDQLRISLIPTLTRVIGESLFTHSPINFEHCYNLGTSRSPSTTSAPPTPAQSGEPESGNRGEKQGRQDTHMKISSDTRYFINTDDTCDTSDEDPRPAKRRKPCSAPAVTAPLYLRESRPILSHSTSSLEMDDAQPQADCGYRSTLADDEQHYTPRPSQSPSAPTESVPHAEYQEWPFQGLLKYTKLGNETSYNLEFQLPCIPERLYLPIPSESLSIGSSQGTSVEVGTPNSAVAHSEVRPATLQPKRKRVTWKPEENETILKMKKEGCSWEEIHRALPGRTPGAIQVQYSTKLKK